MPEPDSQTRTEPFQIQLSIPGRAEFLGVVRLAVAGLAHRLGLNLGEAEDLKLAVAEACSRAMQAGREPDSLDIHCEVAAEELQVSIQPRSPQPDLFAPGGPSDLGLFLIEALVDRVDKLDSSSGLKLTWRLQPESHDRGA